jgi:hypothetical protein
MGKPKSTDKVTHKSGPPKKTHQGQGQNSLSKGNKKLSRGQGK